MNIVNNRPDDATGSPLALRPREAAEALGVSPRTLWAWTRTHGVPHLKIGRTIPCRR